MKFIIVLFISIFVTLFLQSCKENIKYSKTDSGLEYFYFTKADSGSFGKSGDFYLLDMVGRRSDDSVFIDSYQLGQKIKMVRTLPPLHSMFNDALAMLRIGDSIIFKMSADSFFKPLQQPVPKYLKGNEHIRFTIKVKDILNPQAHLLKMYQYELDKMETYLKIKQWSYSTDTATGIKYEIVRKGNSNFAQNGDEVEISYLLTYLDGKIINHTKPGDKLKFKVGSPDYIQCLSKLAKLSSEGSKLQAVIPFAEGFGQDGSAYVAPYSTLVIEMDIIKVYKNSKILP